MVCYAHKAGYSRRSTHLRDLSPLTLFCGRDKTPFGLFGISETQRFIRLSARFRPPSQSFDLGRSVSAGRLHIFQEGRCLLRRTGTGTCPVAMRCSIHLCCATPKPLCCHSFFRRARSASLRAVKRIAHHLVVPYLSASQTLPASPQRSAHTQRNA